MLDIIDIQNGEDLLVMDSVVAKAGNVLSIQIGSLEYAPTFGVDLVYFLQTDLKFQNDSFKAYLVQRLSENQISVSEVMDTLETFAERYTFFVGDTRQNNGGLIA